MAGGRTKKSHSGQGIAGPDAALTNLAELTFYLSAKLSILPSVLETTLSMKDALCLSSQFQVLERQRMEWEAAINGVRL